MFLCVLNIFKRVIIKNSKMMILNFLATAVFLVNFSLNGNSNEIHYKEKADDVKSKYDIVVDANGTGNFKTVQEAFNSVASLKTTETKILKKNNITLIGESKEKVILTYDDYASKSNGAGATIGTSGSASFIVTGNDFKTKNITFENASDPVAQDVTF